MAEKDNRKYRWGAWFAKPRFRIVRRRDYRCPQSAMAQQIRNVARRLRLYVSLVDEGDAFTVIVHQRRRRSAKRVAPLPVEMIVPEQLPLEPNCEDGQK